MVYGLIIAQIKSPVKKNILNRWYLDDKLDKYQKYSKKLKKVLDKG